MVTSACDTASTTAAATDQSGSFDTCHKAPVSNLAALDSLAYLDQFHVGHERRTLLDVGLRALPRGKDQYDVSEAPLLLRQSE